MIVKDSSRQLQRHKEERHRHSRCTRIHTYTHVYSHTCDRRRSLFRLKCLHSSFFPLHRAGELLLKSASGERLGPQFRARRGRKVLLRHLDTDSGGGAALGRGGLFLLNFGWSPLLLGHGCAQTVEPLLLVVDVVDIQGVGLVVGWVEGAHAENIFN